MITCDSEGEAVSIGQAPLTMAPTSVSEGLDLAWYAVLTRSRHENAVARRLREAGVPVFLPVVTETRVWSDRKKKVELPLFSCYVFARLLSNKESRLKALRIDGVLSLVGTRGEGTPIPDEQIETVRRLIDERLRWRFHPFLNVGQRVRIRGGALDGMEGVLAARAGESTLVISVDAIQRSLEVRVSGYEIEPI